MHSGSEALISGFATTRAARALLAGVCAVILLGIGASGAAAQQGVFVGPSAFVESFRDIRLSPDDAPLSPGGVAISPNGVHTYITDAANHRVLRIDNRNHRVELFAGGPEGSPIQFDGSLDARNVRLNGVGGIAITPNGRTAYVADTQNDRILAVDVATHSAELFAGTSSRDVAPNHIDAADARNTRLQAPVGIVANSRFVYVTEGNRVLRVATNDRSVERVAGVDGVAAGIHANDQIDEGSAPNTQLNSPGRLALSPNSPHLYVTDNWNNRVLAINTSDLTVRRIAGSMAIGARDLEMASARRTRLYNPKGVAVSADGRYVYISDSMNNRVLRVNPHRDFVRELGDDKPNHVSIVNPGNITIAPDGSLLINRTLGQERDIVLVGFDDWVDTHDEDPYVEKRRPFEQKLQGLVATGVTAARERDSLLLAAVSTDLKLLATGNHQIVEGDEGARSSRLEGQGTTDPLWTKLRFKLLRQHPHWNERLPKDVRESIAGYMDGSSDSHFMRYRAQLALHMLKARVAEMRAAARAAQ